MPKFRKKPVVIEAEQLDRDKLHRLSPEFRAAVCDDGVCAPVVREDGFRVLHIHTLEGAHVVTDGDWIIKCVNGEFYPCKPDIFAKTYEVAE